MGRILCISSLKLGTSFFIINFAGIFKIIVFSMSILPVLSTILNGLGKTKDTLLHNSVSLVIQICFILFVIPLYGVRDILEDCFLVVVVPLLGELSEIENCDLIGFRICDKNLQLANSQLKFFLPYNYFFKIVHLFL